MVWARPNQSPEAGLGITRSITISPTFFQPVDPGTPYHNGGYYINVTQGYGTFTAPVAFPCLGRVQVQAIKLFVEDGNPNQEACVQMFHTTPNPGTKVMRACSW